VRSIEAVVPVGESRTSRIVLAGVTGRGAVFVDPLFGIVETFVGHGIFLRT
jgi:hypothetical protein